jgi:hypothetical protein
MVRQVGWICAAAQGIEVKDRGQVPAEPGGQVQAATGKKLCGEGSPGLAFSSGSGLRGLVSRRGSGSPSCAPGVLGAPQSVKWEACGADGGIRTCVASLAAACTLGRKVERTWPFALS